MLQLDASLAASSAAAALSKTSLTGGAQQINAAANITAPSYALDYDLGSLEIDDFKDRIAYPDSPFIEETQALEQLVRAHTVAHRPQAERPHVLRLFVILISFSLVLSLECVCLLCL